MWCTIILRSGLITGLHHVCWLENLLTSRLIFWVYFMWVWVSACVYIFLSRTVPVWWMEWRISPAGDCIEGSPPVCVCVCLCMKGGLTGLDYPLQSCAPAWKLTRQHTHFDQHLGNDKCGPQCSPQLQGSSLHRDPLSPFLTGKSEKRGHNGAVSREKDVRRWWPGPWDHGWSMLGVSLWVEWKCPNLPLWIWWTVTTPHDRCFIILMITSRKLGGNAAKLEKKLQISWKSFFTWGRWKTAISINR